MPRRSLLSNKLSTQTLCTMHKQRSMLRKVQGILIYLHVYEHLFVIFYFPPQYKAKGIICLEAAHDCAISEYCSGSSGSCHSSSPSKRNGAKCQVEEENGICVYGVCKSFYEQCQDSSSVRRSGIGNINLSLIITES
jgi:hypothetical protein